MKKLDVGEDRMVLPLYVEERFGKNNITRSFTYLLQGNKEDEPSKKRYRMDLRRHLSLDLERVPSLEDSAEEGSEFESAAIRDSFGPSLTGDIQKLEKLSVGGMQLDINAIPDLSTPAGSFSTGSKDQEPEEVSLWPAEAPQALTPSSVLHIIYLGLVKWLGQGALEEKQESIQSRSLRIRVSHQSPVEYQRSGKGVTQGVDDHAGSRPVVILICEWSGKDEVLAMRSLGILRRLKLKLS